MKKALVFFLEVTNFAVILLKKCSYFARIFTKLSPYEEFSTLQHVFTYKVWKNAD